MKSRGNLPNIRNPLDYKANTHTHAAWCKHLLPCHRQGVDMSEDERGMNKGDAKQKNEIWKIPRKFLRDGC